jgi:putative phosphoserine phosphatase / 1-acylglycerol-3-phosphate O-acyltransferase
MQENLIAIGRLAIVYSMLSLTGVIAFVVRSISLGMATDLVRRGIVAPSSRLILRLIGVRLALPPRSAFDHRYVMYTFNHNSYFDVLIITALGLTNTRCFLSEKTLKFVPVTISALAIGTLYIPMMKHAKRRQRFFERTTERIMRERFSVLVSSEGVHTFVDGIAPFNDGVYRMAVEAGLPVVPVYLHIPREVNSLEGFKYKSGSIRVEVLPPIPTGDWSLDRLAEHVDSVRNIFISRFNEAHGDD